ncbi:hypothetical protein NKH77_13770 [Streptomyces sp. M19]
MSAKNIRCGGPTVPTIPTIPAFPTLPPWVPGIPSGAPACLRPLPRPTHGK